MPSTHIISQDLGDTFETLSRMSSVPGKFDFFADLMADMGFSNTYYGRQAVGRGDPIVFRRWDKDWAELYEAKRYAMWDDAIKKGQQSDQPFSLRIQSEIRSEKQAEFYRAAEAHNRLNGFGVPFAPFGGLGKAGISVTGMDRAPPDGAVLAVAAYGYVFNLSVSGEMASRACKAHNVTPREVILLRLLGEGATHVDIAKILGISEDWAHKSFARLRDKLDVPTDPALIRRALEVGLLT